MTPEERSQINRDNAKKLTGPKTEAGKAISRQNSTTHGMRARVLPLPEEEPAQIEARSESWNDYYDPQSPAEQHLVNEGVAATLQADRCHRHQHAIVSKQVRDAQDIWDNAQTEELIRLQALLSTDPGLAVRGLRRFALGCRWLIEQWEALRERFIAGGRWCNSDRELVLRLNGMDPNHERMHLDPDLYIVYLYNMLASEQGRDKALWELMRTPEVMPDVLRPHLMQGIPSAAHCREHLLGDLEHTLADLTALEAELLPRAEADRAEAGDRALLIADPTTARLLLRYQTEARTTFHRAFSALEKLRRERETTVSPNEPNAVEPPPQLACPQPTCAEPTPVVPEAPRVEVARRPAERTAEPVRPAPRTRIVEATDSPCNSIVTIARVIPPPNAACS